MLVLLVSLTGCNWQWVAQYHERHGHTQGQDSHHLIDDYRREARLYTAYWNSRASRIPYESNWDRVAYCESTGNWSANTGNGYYGGLQFSLSTWAAYGGIGNPANASKRTQITIAERVRIQSGLHNWPICGSRW